MDVAGAEWKIGEFSHKNLISHFMLIGGKRCSIFFLPRFENTYSSVAPWKLEAAEVHPHRSHSLNQITKTTKEKPKRKENK